MKNLKSLLAITMIMAAFLVTSCRINSELTAKTKAASIPQSPQKNNLYINLYSGYDRTALPEIDFADYKYELINVTNGKSQTIFSNCSYTNLGQAISLDPAKYTFTLNAYSSDKIILSGTQPVDLSAGGKYITFPMFAVSGNQGAAQVKISFPADAPVVTAKSLYSTNIIANESLAQPVDIGNDGATKSVLFSKGSLPSNTEQYVCFWFYDTVGNLIYSTSEALLVVGGKTSYSNITLTNDDWLSYNAVVSVYLDGAAWNEEKTLALVDTTSSKTYNLKKQYNNYKASVALGTYYIYLNGKNTNIQFQSQKKSTRIDYYSVTMEATSGTQLTPVSGGINTRTNYAIVFQGDSFTYSLDLSPGYRQKASFVISQNGTPISNPQLNTNITIPAVNEKTVIAVTNLELITYTITYDRNGGKWKSGYTAPTSFTVESPAVIPTIANIEKQDALFDVWVMNGTSTSVKTTEGIFENLVLSATWKDIPRVVAEDKTIYANGVSLIICKNGAETNVWVDFNGNGKRSMDSGSVDTDSDDYQLVANDGVTTDFTNYILRAGNEAGTEIKSDFTFTMTGGKIAAIYGLDSKTEKHENHSILNISGNSIIGSTAPIETVRNANGSTSKITTEVQGVMLETITNERVNIVGSMTGDYSVVCVSPYFFEKDTPHQIAYIGNSNWANMTNFTCYTKHNDTTAHIDTDFIHYDRNLLTVRDVIENGVTRKIILLADSDGLNLPTMDEINGDVITGFTLGENRIASECSVFSLSVINGTFTLGRTTFTNPEGDYDIDGIEATLDYMAQPTPTTYVERQDLLTTTTPYVYMQILSSGNAITSEIASDFLSKITFKRSDADKKITIKVNLETVPAADIRDADVKYFDGSFYKRYNNNNCELYKSGKKDWISCYDNAKTKSFNGLTGYLMNISSEVENTYIYYRYGTNASWIGGCRLLPQNNANGTPDWDANTFVALKNSSNAIDDSNDIWYWQAGPEAGQPFWRKKTYAGSVASAEKDFLVSDNNGSWIYHKWDNKNINNSASSGTEPNNSGSHEVSVQYRATSGALGFWNDLAYTSTTPNGYFAEFTPYGDLCNPTYSSLKKEASY